MRGVRRTIAMLAAGVVASAALPVVAQDDTADLLGFLEGSYAFVGREPDTGATYAGTAALAIAGDRLVLTRHIGDRTVSGSGTVEVPQPPGEGRVLRFRFDDSGAVEMTCMIGSDLDNYARLTCLWRRAGTTPAAPGLEAWFATATWPQP